MLFKKSEEKREKKALKKEMKAKKKALKRTERKRGIMKKKLSIVRVDYKKKEKTLRGSKMLFTHLEGFPGFYPVSPIQIEKGKVSQTIVVRNRPYKVIGHKFGYRKTPVRRVSGMLPDIAAGGSVLDTLISKDLDKSQEPVLGLYLMNKDGLSFTPIFRCSRVEYKVFKILIS